eukprot:4215075-Amphidinium_carterae.1
MDLLLCIECTCREQTPELCAVCSRQTLRAVCSLGQAALKLFPPVGWSEDVSVRLLFTYYSDVTGAHR